jgi:hypothetical protein
MSDYLWDKSGEPDPEIERLEELFKDLRYQPRELELPLDAQLAVAARRNYWPRLAAAAALILMGLAGFWLVRHRGSRVASPSSAVAQVNQETQPPREANAGTDSSTSLNASPVKVYERPANERVEGPRRQALLHTAVRRRQELAGPQMVEPNTTNVSPERREVADVGPQRRLEEQREQQAEGLRAKEELLLALQVASAKLNHAQRKAKGGTSIPGPDSKPAVPANIPWNKSR